MEQFSAFADSCFDSGAFCEGWKKFREKWKKFRAPCNSYRQMISKVPESRGKSSSFE